ncbi:discoidin domain-containing protein [Pyxidicoccus sp. 3LG]
MFLGARALNLTLTALLLCVSSAGCVVAPDEPPPVDRPAAQVAAPLNLAPIQISTVGAADTAYATFQSHNQKVVSHPRYGIFVSYEYKESKVDPVTPPSAWRLARSTDGGASFVTVYDSETDGQMTHFGSRAPALEIDDDGLIYLVHSNWKTGYGYFKVFSPENGYHAPVRRTSIPNGSAMKHTMVLDRIRRRIYTFGEQRLITLDLGGAVLSSVALTTKGANAEAHYPHLFVDEHGEVWAAWTSLRYTSFSDKSCSAGCAGAGLDGRISVDAGGDDTMCECAATDASPAACASACEVATGGSGEVVNGRCRCDPWTYWGIHFMVSRNGGVSWETPTGDPVSLPVMADETGPTPWITLDDEFTSHTWLAHFRVHGGKNHFFYQAQTIPSRQHTVRFDLFDGLRDHGIYPDWSGGTLAISDLGLGCATHAGRPTGPIYCVGTNAADVPGQPDLVALSSADNGLTWQDFAMGPSLGDVPYSIGAARTITHDGYFIGTYTDQDRGENPYGHVVKFFKLPVGSASSVRLPAGVTVSAAAAGYPGSFAGDEGFQSTWIANLTYTTANNTAWAQLDLGVVRRIDQLRWRAAAGEPFPAHGPTDYQIHVSNDGATWQLVADRHARIAVLEGAEPIGRSARYVRLSTTKVHSGAGWALGLRELWAEGPALPVGRLAATIATSAQATSYPAANAGDGDSSTQWVASLTVDPVNNNAWVRLDLGAVKQIERLRWLGAAGTPHPAHSPRDFTIEVSNDTIHWSPLVRRAAPTSVTNGDEALGVPARYVRLSTTQVNDGSGWALSFAELWAEGSELPVVRLPSQVSVSGQAAAYPAGFADDGSAATPWVASLVAQGGNNQAWITLDLGRVRRVERLRWTGAASAPYPAHSPTDYSIRVSYDGVTWTTLMRRVSSAPVVDGNEPLGVAARYVRLETTKVNDGTGWSLGFYDLFAEGAELDAARLPATVSTSSSASGFPAAAANDADTSTLWLARLTPAAGNNSAWVTLDLGTPSWVDRLRWLAADGAPYPAGEPTDYTVSSSMDGNSWTQVMARTSAGAHDTALVGDEHVGRMVRYLRVQTSKVRDGTGWALGLPELWAEGWTARPTRLPAILSANAAAEGYPVARAGDGDGATAWLASLLPDDANNNAWVRLDFGAPRYVERLRWTTADGTPYPAGAPTDYVVEVSNTGTSWSTVATRTGTHPGALRGEERIAGTWRYARLRTTKVRDGSGWALGVYEIWAEN